MGIDIADLEKLDNELRFEDQLDFPQIARQFVSARNLFNTKQYQEAQAIYNGACRDAHELRNAHLVVSGLLMGLQRDVGAYIDTV